LAPFPSHILDKKFRPRPVLFLFCWEVELLLEDADADFALSDDPDPAMTLVVLLVKFHKTSVIFCVTPHVYRAHSHFEIEFTQVRRIASDPYFYAVWASLIPCT